MSLTIDLTAANLTLISHWLLLVLIAAIAGLLIEVGRGGGVLLSFVGGIGAALLGAWAVSDLLIPRLSISPGPVMDDVALLPAAVGALLLSGIWSLLGSRGRR